jgi:hypothetical protein
VATMVVGCVTAPEVVGVTPTVVVGCVVATVVANVFAKHEHPLKAAV